MKLDPELALPVALEELQPIPLGKLVPPSHGGSSPLTPPEAIKQLRTIRQEVSGYSRAKVAQLAIARYRTGPRMTMRLASGTSYNPEEAIAAIRAESAPGDYLARLQCEAALLAIDSAIRTLTLQRRS